MEPLASCIIVGCALLPKKASRYLTPRMLATAAAHGIVLKQIDAAAPLGPQGPFHVILHKLRPDAGWEASLRAYVAAHPDVVVVDSIDRIRQLHNRATMLRPLQGAGITLQQPTQQQPERKPPQVVRVQAPLQVELLEGTSEADAHAALAAAGLAPPLLCKPLWTDGRDGSHQLAVLHDLDALGRLLRGGEGGCGEFKPPLVVQQFVEHSGVLFKVYVLGERTYVTARPSLGQGELEPDSAAVQQLPRISCVSYFRQQQQQHEPEEQHQHQRQPSAALAAVAAESVWQPPRCSTAPPAWLTSALAATLRQELGMCLFNFDLLIPAQTQQQQRQQQGHAAGEEEDAADTVDAAYVVDVNYFPGLDKLPNFEARFVEFLLAAAARGGGASTATAKQQQQGQPLPAVATAAGAGEPQQAAGAAEPPTRLASSSGGGRRLSSSSGCGSQEGATAAAGQWDAANQQGLPLGSSPPLQVAGCS